MVFEDIHWADSALLDFIEYLVEWSRERPIFVVTLARPELADRRPAWGAGTRNFTSIFLEPLPADQMDSLLSEPVPGLPDELRTRILERAEGIPFYAVETVRMLIDRGILVRENGAYRLEGSAEKLEVPETLQALIAARLDGLAPEERRLLQDAAVLGRTFTLQGLTAITGLPEDRGDGSPRRARSQGGPLDLDRPAPVRPGAVRIPPGSGQEGRLRHDVEARTQVASLGCRLVPSLRGR